MSVTTHCDKPCLRNKLVRYSLSGLNFASSGNALVKTRKSIRKICRSILKLDSLANYLFFVENLQALSVW
jgi:hypothetical protein